jgi:hypothetical protein
MKEGLGGGMRDYRSLLDRMSAQLDDCADRVAIKQIAAFTLGTGEGPLWKQHAALLGFARYLVRQWRRELAAEPQGHGVQASAVELANALGIRE